MIRDAAGIAHIEADTSHDLFLAQGYVHAQERMWQMEVWRHISRRPPVRAVRAEHAERGPLHPDARLAGGGPARPRRALAGDARRRRCLRGGRQRLDRRRTRARCRCRSWSTGAQGGHRRRSAATTPSRGRRSTRLTWQKVQAWSARRQLRLGDLPDAGRRAAGRPGPDRRALPGLRPGRRPIITPSGLSRLRRGGRDRAGRRRRPDGRRRPTPGVGR